MEDAALGARDWARAAVATVPADADDLIVVAHSTGGFALPLVTELVAVRRLVALAAVLPQPNQSFAAHRATAEGADALLYVPSRPRPGDEVRGESTWDVYRTYYVEDCTDEDARWAWQQLRPRAVTVYVEPSTIGAWPLIPTTSIVMQGDRIVHPAWSRRVARRIGADLVELPGGHSPFLANPELLARTLLAIASQDASAQGRPKRLR